MNANELADELKEYALDNGYSHIDYADSMNQAATMLRQQQERIIKYEIRNIVQMDRIIIMEIQLKNIKKNE